MNMRTEQSDGLTSGDHLRIFVSAQSMACCVDLGQPIARNGRPKDVRAIMSTYYPNDEWGRTAKVLLRQVVDKMESQEMRVPEQVYRIMRKHNV